MIQEQNLCHSVIVNHIKNIILTSNQKNDSPLTFYNYSICCHQFVQKLVLDNAKY